MTLGARVARIALVVVPVTFLGVFFVWPVVAILSRGLAPNGSLDLEPVLDVVTDPTTREIAWFTVWQAAVSTVITLLVGLPVACVLARFRFPGRSLTRAAVTIPFVLPTVVVGVAFAQLLGGWPLKSLGIAESVWAILLAHVFFNLAVVARTVGGLWAHLDPRTEDAARVLGAGRVRVFREVTLPALRPAIVAAASIVFLFCFTSFGVILILGGPRHATLETEIYRETAQLLDLRTAAALSIVQLAAVLAALAVGSWARGRRADALRLRASREIARPPRTTGERVFLGTTLAGVALLVGTPLLVLVARSFDLGGDPSLRYYRALAQTPSDATFITAPLHAVTTSLRFAAIATVIALIVGGAATFALARSRQRRAQSGRARSRPMGGGLDALVMLPLGISAVTVGFGFLIALDEPPLDLRTSPWLVPIAQAIVAIPFVVRTVLPVVESIDPRLREAATMLGAAPRLVWRHVDLAIAGRALLVAAGFAFAISLGEFGATIFIVRADAPTLPVVIFRLLGRPGALNNGQAMAASVLLMALTAVAVMLADRFRVGSVGEF